MVRSELLKLTLNMRVTVETWLRVSTEPRPWTCTKQTVILRDVGTGSAEQGIAWGPKLRGGPGKGWSIATKILWKCLEFCDWLCTETSLTGPHATNSLTKASYFQKFVWNLNSLSCTFLGGIGFPVLDFFGLLFLTIGLNFQEQMLPPICFVYEFDSWPWKKTWQSTQGIIKISYSKWNYIVAIVI